MKQPWASALAYDLKSIDIRTWRTHYRGAILIHASKGYDYVGEQALGEAVMKVLRKTSSLPTGGVIARASLTMMVVYQNRQQFAKHFTKHRNPLGWFKENETFGWVFSGMQPLKFIPVKGQLRLFEVEFASK